MMGFCFFGRNFHDFLNIYILFQEERDSCLVFWELPYWGIVRHTTHFEAFRVVLRAAITCVCLLIWTPPKREKVARLEQLLIAGLQSGVQFARGKVWMRELNPLSIYCTCSSLPVFWFSLLFNQSKKMKLGIQFCFLVKEGRKRLHSCLLYKL